MFGLIAVGFDPAASITQSIEIHLKFHVRGEFVLRTNMLYTKELFLMLWCAEDKQRECPCGDSKHQ